MIDFKWMVIILTYLLAVFFIYLTGKGEDEK
jgi:hypothetical protein